MSVVARPSALRMTPASQTRGACARDFEDGVAGDLQAGVDAEDALAERPAGGVRLLEKRSIRHGRESLGRVDASYLFLSFRPRNIREVAEPREVREGAEPMPHVSCPACARVITLQDAELLLLIECARCNTRFRPMTPVEDFPKPLPPTRQAPSRKHEAPPAPAATVSEQEAPTPAPVKKRRRRKKKGFNWKTLAVAVSVSLGVLAIFSVGITVLVKSGVFDRRPTSTPVVQTPLNPPSPSRSPPPPTPPANTPMIPPAPPMPPAQQPPVGPSVDLGGSLGPRR